MATEIRGLKEAFATLRKIDPELYKQVRKDIKNDAAPMVMAAKALIPQVPISGWLKEGSGSSVDKVGRKTLRTKSGFPVFVPSKAKSGVSLSIKNRKMKGYGGRWLAIAMVQNDAAGMIYDYARNSTNNNRFPSALNRRNPQPSRYMWKAAEQHMGDVYKSVRQSVTQVEKRINQELR